MGSSNSKSGKAGQIFDTLDADKSGFLDLVEIEAWIQDEMFWKNPLYTEIDDESATKSEFAKKKAAELFQRILAHHQTSQQGTGEEKKVMNISRKMFLAYWDTQDERELHKVGSSLLDNLRERKHEIAAQVFKLLDKDGTGRLTHKEVAEWFLHEKAWDKIYRTPSQKESAFVKTFKKMDVDQTQTVSQAEFIKFVENWSVRDLRERSKQAYVDFVSKRSGEAKARAVGFSQRINNCMVCMAAIPPEQYYFACGLDLAHDLCGGCFVSYVESCCENYTEDKFPMRCSMPTCAHPVFDTAIEFLLNDNKRQDVWIRYQRVQLLAGLVDDKQFVPVTCEECKSYTALLPRDYQVRANRHKDQMQKSKEMEDQRIDAGGWTCKLCEYQNVGEDQSCLICRSSRLTDSVFYCAKGKSNMKQYKDGKQLQAVDFDSFSMAHGYVVGIGPSGRIVGTYGGQPDPHFKASYIPDRSDQQNNHFQVDGIWFEDEDSLQLSGQWRHPVSGTRVDDSSGAMEIVVKPNKSAGVYQLPNQHKIEVLKYDGLSVDSAALSSIVDATYKKRITEPAGASAVHDRRESKSGLLGSLLSVAMAAAASAVSDGSTLPASQPVLVSRSSSKRRKKKNRRRRVKKGWTSYQGGKQEAKEEEEEEETDGPDVPDGELKHAGYASSFPAPSAPPAVDDEGVLPPPPPGEPDPGHGESKSWSGPSPGPSGPSPGPSAQREAEPGGPGGVESKTGRAPPPPPRLPDPPPPDIVKKMVMQLKDIIPADSPLTQNQILTTLQFNQWRLNDTLATLVRDMQRASINRSDLYFECRTPGCGHSMCLCCRQTVSMQGKATHGCHVTPEDRLYMELVDLLAEHSTMHCPSCKKGFQKDFACTHMSCICKKRWCYHCGQEFSNFSPHNEWTLQSAPDKCPMYLKYRYGNGEPQSGRLGGDDRDALYKFSALQQKLAVFEWEKKLKPADKAAYQRMLKKRFRDGIWDAQTEQAIKTLNETWLKHAARREPYDRFLPSS